ncbi:MAG: hypothetical protein V3S02_05570 [Dehalococcoidales bacterium]
MPESKYGKYILRGTEKKQSIPETSSVVLGGAEDWNGIQHRINWQYVSGPNVMVEEPHTHDFDKFLVFLGTNPANADDFDAEIELTLGEEGETYTINTATVVVIPKGMVHCPLNFKRIGKPILFCNIYLATEYVKTAWAGQFTKTTGSKYEKYIIREPKKGEPRKLDSEAWGVSITEEITSKIGKFNCNFNFLGIMGPHVLPDPPHQHNCDEILFLIPGTSGTGPDLGGEVELAFGEEWEKQTITTAAIVCLPKEIVHCPVYIKKVDKPFYWGHILFASSYDSSAFNPERPL